MSAGYVEGADLTSDGTGHEDFPFEEVDRRLAGAIEQLSEPDMEGLMVVLQALAEFQIGRPRFVKGELRKDFDQTVGRQTITFWWALFPSLFGGASLASIARALGISPAALAMRSAEFSRRFGIRTRPQAQGAGKFRKGHDANKN